VWQSVANGGAAPEVCGRRRPADRAHPGAVVRLWERREAYYSHVGR
jgi:hypothetical protein